MGGGLGGARAWTRPLAATAATVAMLLPVLGWAVPPAQASTAGATTNLEVAGGVPVALDGGGLAFQVPESGHGGRDLNSDGDIYDWVLHVSDSASRTTNLAIASSWAVALEGGGVAFRAVEYEQGYRDLNSDGDTNDEVLHVWDPTNRTTNFGIAGSVPVALEGGGLSFLGLEFAHGVDLNSDGDTNDEVLHVWDPTNRTTNLGIAGGSPSALAGGGLAFRASESAQGGRDLNSDGDTTDSVQHVWDPTNRTTNLGIASNWAVTLDAGGLAFHVSESAQGGRDLNSDADTTDGVLHVWDPTNRTTNLGIAGDSPLAVAGGGLAFRASESAHGGRDLNSDGDTTDWVQHVWDPTNVITNLGIASNGAEALDGGGLAFRASESFQGSRDLNSDGDATDEVPHVWDPTNRTTNLGIASNGAGALDGGGLAFAASEAGHGGRDLNSDGDTTDDVLHVWDPANRIINLGIASRGLRALDGGGLAFAASEAGHGGRDLNGDGDTNDLVLHVWQPAAGSPEVCDGIDNDLDGTVDNGVTTTFYADGDSDGYGDPNVTTVACSAPAGYVADNTDADDADPTVHPGAAELCDGKDNDQDGTVDEGWPDADGDSIADCVDPDDDGDGIADGEDPDVVATAVSSLASTSIAAGNRNAFLSRLHAIEALVAAGDAAAAIEELEALRRRVDGCDGTSRERPEKNDWIFNCGDQRAIRQLIDQLIANLEATLTP